MAQRMAEMPPKMSPVPELAERHTAERKEILQRNKEILARLKEINADQQVAARAKKPMLFVLPKGVAGSGELPREGVSAPRGEVLEEGGEVILETQGFRDLGGKARESPLISASPT